MKLTAKQDKFARLVAEGNTQIDAYRKSYNASKMKPESTQNEAYKLMQNPEIALRVKELKTKLTEKLDLASTITVERQLKYAQKILQESLKQNDWNHSLKAMQEQNKLLGLYAPSKIDQTNTNYDVLSNVSPDTQNKIVKLIKNG